MVINMAEMKYTKIPYVNRPVSRILYGTATDTMIAGKDCKELLDDIFALGVNAFDCAREYKLAEKSLGDWLEVRGNRDQVTILSKGGHPGPQWEKRINETEIRKDFACSSGYLKTDYIDIYLLHRDDPMVGVGEIVELLNAMHSEGKIGAFGGSNWTHERIAEANEYAYKHDMLPFTVSSPNFGLANQIQDPFEGGCVTISGPSQETARKWYLDNQMPVIAYSSLGRGLFSGRVKSDDPGTIEKNMDEYATKKPNVLFVRLVSACLQRLGVWQVWESVLRFRPPTKTPERAKPLRSPSVPHIGYTPYYRLAFISIHN